MNIKPILLLLCEMDNLYISVWLAKMCLLSTSKIMISGVCHAKGRGMPICIEQQEETRKEDKMKKQGTLKVAVLENDPLCKALLLALSTIQSHFTSFQVVVGKSNGVRRSERYGMRKNT